MRRLLRILLVCTAPFLLLSLGLALGLSFASGFILPVTVENQTAQSLLVTPVGSWGQGHKDPLPLMLFHRLALPAPRVGGLRLEPRESLTFFYDQDDITCSELVLEDERGRLRQYVTESESTPGWPREHHTLTDFESLPAPGLDVLAASVAARESRAGLLVLLLVLLIGPWVAFAVLRSRLTRLETSASPRPPGE